MGDNERTQDKPRESGGSQHTDAQRGQRAGASPRGDDGAKGDVRSDKAGGAKSDATGAGVQRGQRSDGGGGMTTKDATSAPGKAPDRSDGPAKPSDGGGGMTTKDATSAPGKAPDRSDATPAARGSGKPAEAAPGTKAPEAPHPTKKADEASPAKPADADHPVKPEVKPEAKPASGDPLKDGRGPREPEMSDKEMLELYNKIADDLYFTSDKDFAAKYGYTKEQVQMAFKPVFERQAEALKDIARQPQIGRDRHYEAEQKLKAFNQALEAMKTSAAAGLAGGVRAMQTNDMKAIRDAALAGKNVGDLASGVGKAGTPPAPNQGPGRVGQLKPFSVESAQGPNQGGTKGETRSK
jgi:hypothetical protein